MKRLFKLLIAMSICIAPIKVITADAASVQTSDAIKLIDAHLTDNHFYYSLEGELDILNIGYRKQVNAQFTTTNGSVSIAADYKMPLEKGHELWIFHTNLNKSEVPANGIVLTLSMNSSGKTIVSKQNFSLNPQFNPIVLGERPIVLETAAFDWTENRATGSIIVRNVGYAKTVKVVYTTDHWITKKIAFARFAEQIDDENGDDHLERWTFQLPVGEKATDIEFATALMANKTTWWDNHHLQNYKLTR